MLPDMCPWRIKHGVVCALSFALFFLLAGLSAGTALAQTVAINEGSITRSKPFRPASQNPMWISKSDCVDDDSFFFPLTVANYGSYQLEVWAGSASDDCSAAEARRGSTAVCWQLYKGVPTSTGFQVPIKTRDIVGRHKPTEPGEPGPGSGTAADCEWKEASTAPVEVGLYFMFIGAGSDQQYGGVLWTTKYDLAGPNPPNGITAGIGNTMIVVSWNESTDTDKVGYEFYCDPVPGVVPKDTEDDSSNPSGDPPSAMHGVFDLDASDPLDDAPDDVADGEPTVGDSGGDDALDEGDVGDAEGDDGSHHGDTGVGPDVGGSGGSDGGGGGSSGGECGSVVLIPGVEPDRKYYCGKGTGTTGTISGLENGVQYSVAVAAYDSVGNVGKLSNVACAVPSEVDDFFTKYREAGGKAGGGFCTFTNVGTSAWSSGFAVFALFVMAALGSVIRWRRSR